MVDGDDDKVKTTKERREMRWYSHAIAVFVVAFVSPIVYHFAKSAFTAARTASLMAADKDFILSFCSPIFLLILLHCGS